MTQQKIMEIFKDNQEWSEDKLEYVLLQSDFSSISKKLTNLLDNWISVERKDIEKIRRIIYVTFGEGNPDKKKPKTREEHRIVELENKINKIDKIIYPKYYKTNNEDVKNAHNNR